MIYMDTTKIDCEKTAAEIQSLLGKHGATQILMEYENREIVALSFILKTRVGERAYCLPVRWKPIFQIIHKKSRSRGRYSQKAVENDEAQARRTAWRIVLRWVQAQLAFTEVGMVTIDEIMLPYMKVQDRLFYEHLLEHQLALPEK